ncbi:hypothetical protein DVH24_007990 [Malus domestica]|uniref:Uncharacterized protein n=1 Tax=Malus domestica TaxID=3750 RepID=A0A498JIW6_MALDO|nr:hypothetical protein DVH24_007990 [Malus domestica]
MVVAVKLPMEKFFNVSETQAAISFTSLWNENLWISSLVLFWYFLIFLCSATVPGLIRWGFFTPLVARADFQAALVATLHGRGYASG